MRIRASSPLEFASCSWPSLSNLPSVSYTLALVSARRRSMHNADSLLPHSSRARGIGAAPRARSAALEAFQRAAREPTTDRPLKCFPPFQCASRAAVAVAELFALGALRFWRCAHAGRRVRRSLFGLIFCCYLSLVYWPVCKYLRNIVGLGD